MPFVVAVTVVSLLTIRRAEQHQRMNNNSLLVRASAVAGEAIFGHEIVSSFNAHAFEIRRYTDCVQNSEPFGVRKSWSNAVFISSYMFFMFVAIALLFGLVVITSYKRQF